MKKLIFILFGLFVCGCNSLPNEKDVERIGQRGMDSLILKRKKENDSLANKQKKENDLILKRKNGIYNEWVMNKILMEPFDEDTLDLSILDSADGGWDRAFTFHKNGSLTYREYNAPARCGNGIFSLKDTSSTWQIDSVNKKMVFTVLYDYSMEFFDHKSKVEYKILSSKPGRLLLLKSKTYYDKTKKMDWR